MGARRWSFVEAERDAGPSPWIGFVLGNLSTLGLVAAAAIEYARGGADLPFYR